LKNRFRAALIAVPVLLAASVTFPAEDEPGGLLGWVEDTRGAPVAGAVISLFGKGVGAAGLVTLSDSTGRFFLPSLPAGSYTVRALRAGHQAAKARQVTVLPNRELRFTMSLAPEDLAAAAAAAAAPVAKPEDGADARKTSGRELAWLLRHKRRSVLEQRERDTGETDTASAPRTALASVLPPLGATLEVVTHPDSMGLGDDLLEGDGPAASLSALRLEGRLSESGRWSLGGLLSESGTTSWRMAAEFVLEAGDHEIRAGSGYGTRQLRAVTEGPAARDERVGAIFLEDRWEAADDLTATVGARFSHVGFLSHANSFDPMVAVDYRPAEHTVVRTSFFTRTIAPGGDLLTLSTLATAPSIAQASMDEGLRAERLTRLELSVEETVGSTTVRAYTFYEAVRDHLGNAVEPQRAGDWARYAPAAPSTMRIFNAGRLATRGMGLTVGRRFGQGVSGSMTYTYGHGWRPEQDLAALPAGLAGQRLMTFSEADFHDVVARLETVISGSDTRLAALYRLNNLIPQGVDESVLTSGRFDLQLSQGLPFLGNLTHADWDLLIAVRNFYYEAGEGAMLDEVVVLNPPRRVLGGIAVRF
jgi:hypothetical protein